MYYWIIKKDLFLPNALLAPIYLEKKSTYWAYSILLDSEKMEFSVPPEVSLGER